MKLGYIWVAPRQDRGLDNRASYARAIGFSEFLTPDRRSDRNDADGSLARFKIDRDPSGDTGTHLRLVGEMADATTPRYSDPFLVEAGPNQRQLRDLSRGGAHLMSSCASDAEQLASHWAGYVEGCTHGSIRACLSHWRVARIALVSHDTDRARSAVMDPDGPCFAHLAQALGPAASPGDLAALADRVVLHGTPDDVAAALAGLRDQVGRFGTLLLADLAWPDRDLARQSLTLMAQHVCPALESEARPSQMRQEFA